MVDDLEALLVTNLPLLERLVRAACRGSSMREADVEDFLSEVKLKLVEREYHVLRSFRGRCSMATWLALIVQRQLLDYRAQTKGRFRPSAEAQRLGADAVRLETLLIRDRKPLAEAVELLRRSGSAMTPAEGERIAARLPRRQPRAVTVALDDAGVEPAAPQGDAGTSRDREAASRTVSVTLRDAIGGLLPEDQAVLRMHFVAGMSIVDVARALGREPHRVYRLVRSLCADLHERLLAAGIDAQRIRELLESGDTDFDLGLDSPPESAARPTTKTRMQHE